MVPTRWSWISWIAFISFFRGPSGMPRLSVRSASVSSISLARSIPSLVSWEAQSMRPCAARNMWRLLQHPPLWEGSKIAPQEHYHD